MKTRIGLVLLLFTLPCFTQADCVEGALNKSKFSRLNIHTVALTGGYGSPIVIKTDCRINRNSTVSILKDSFCNDSEAVLFVDGEECAAEHVSESDKITENNLYDEDTGRDRGDKVD
ncbi:MAG: hypothetical protein OQJ84_03930 [Xanthomonadales bacterium]|nr:hypothetical protein [Xanthomonadales bacterium]